MDPRTDYSYNLGLMFYKVAESCGERTALKYPSGERFTYGQLNIISNKIARWLLEKGVVKADVVAIFNEKSPYGYSVMLACLKIGAIYTNLDIGSPHPRIEKILQTCGPKFIFFDESIETNSLYQNIHGFSLVKLDNQFKIWLEAISGDLLTETRNVNGGDPAYIMFTSGSTGFPKGAVMSHSNVLNFIQWGTQTFDVTEEDVFTNANPIYFDNSVFDFYTSIYNGSTLVPLSNGLIKNAKQLVDAINSSKCSIWFSVPSLLVYLLTTRALTNSDFSTIKKMSFGGEGFPKNKLRQLYELFGSRITLYNVYGPTECTCICSSYIITERDFENMQELAPLGFMSCNFSYEILPVDIHNKNFGELALIGPGVGLGYYNDEERTAKSFIQNTNSKFFQRMYKTGDVVERGVNGYLHFRGRVDNQVKHMGYRIELEEVEAAFSTLSYINEVGVLYQKVRDDLGQIKAFVSISDVSKDEKVILNDIKKLLPAYMVPRTLAILPALPKNSNGKIDRKQLAQLS